MPRCPKPRLSLPLSRPGRDLVAAQRPWPEMWMPKSRTRATRAALAHDRHSRAAIRSRGRRTRSTTIVRAPACVSFGDRPRHGSHESASDGRAGRIPTDAETTRAGLGAPPRGRARRYWHERRSRTSGNKHMRSHGSCRRMVSTRQDDFMYCGTDVR